MDDLHVRVRGLRRWEGTVTALDEQLMSVSLVPVDRDGALLEAEFRLDDLSESDRSVVAIGSVVYLTVRTVVSHRGLPSKTASLRLRRFGCWTRSEVDELRAQAAEMSRALGDLAD